MYNDDEIERERTIDEERDLNRKIEDATPYSERVDNKVLESTHHHRG